MTARRTILLLILVAGILLRVRIFSGLPRDLSVCTTDFSPFYAAGKLAATLDMYSPPAIFAAEDAAVGCHIQNLIYIKPPFYALLMRPLTQLPYLTALWLWRILGLAAVGIFLWLWPGSRLAIAAGCAWFLPLSASFTVGQDVALVLALAAGAYRCVKAGRLTWAGVLFGLCAIKFHLFLLLPLFVIHRKLWRVALGWAAVAATLLAVSFMAYGPAWVPRYWAALHDRRLNPYPRNMVNLSGLFHYHAVWLLAAVAVAALCWYVIARAPLEQAFAAMLAGGVLITPHNTISDGVLFLPLLWLALQPRVPAVRALAIFALSPLYAFLPAGTLQLVIIALLAWAAWELAHPTAHTSPQSAVK